MCRSNADLRADEYALSALQSDGDHRSGVSDRQVLVAGRHHSLLLVHQLANMAHCPIPTLIITLPRALYTNTIQYTLYLWTHASWLWMLRSAHSLPKPILMFPVSVFCNQFSTVSMIWKRAHACEDMARKNRVMCVCMFVCTCRCCPLMWVPCCCKSCQDVQHSCPSCHRSIGYKARLWSAPIRRASRQQ